MIKREPSDDTMWTRKHVIAILLFLIAACVLIDWLTPIISKSLGLP